MKRREFITFLGAAAAWPPAAFAQQGYQRLISFLIDLAGWTGSQPAGTDHVGRNGRLITASRRYVRGDASFNAAIFSGTASSTGNITVGEVHKSTSTVDGFQVTTLSTRVFVAISVTLGPDAGFGLVCNGVSEDEAMAIARKFDWKGIQALVN